MPVDLELLDFRNKYPGDSGCFREALGKSRGVRQVLFDPSFRKARFFDISHLINKTMQRNCRASGHVKPPYLFMGELYRMESNVAILIIDQGEFG